MFLVYVPVLAVTVYFCATRCVPASARRVVSRVGSDIVFAGVLAVAKVIRYLAARRSTYIWDTRKRLWQPLASVCDTLLKVDADQALINTSSGQASIRIAQAVSTVGGCDHDTTHILQSMWDHGDGVRIVVPVNVVIECLEMKDLDYNTEVVTRIRYTGHSNKHKRYPAETFSAKYVCQLSEIFRFPPYPSSEAVRRGLGRPRVIRANYAENNGKMLFGHEATESSGLRHDFYASVHDDPCLKKNVVTFFHPGSRYQEKQKIVVTTSKLDGKITCNESKVPT